MLLGQVQLKLKARRSLAADAVQQARQRLQVVLLLLQIKLRLRQPGQDSVSAGP
jgi:hypothetical protein